MPVDAGRCREGEKKQKEQRLEKGTKKREESKEIKEQAAQTENKESAPLKTPNRLVAAEREIRNIQYTK